jgi:ribosomal-protein-alanine N-acetyltransferase
LIRELRPSDAPALYRIETASTIFPWSQKQFAEGLAGGEFGWGVEANGELVGFALFLQVLDEATLLNTAVHPEWRRRHFARALLSHALTQLVARGVARCMLEVRVGNSGAVALYRALGFCVDGRRPNYYPAIGGREDALLMSRALPGQSLEIV